MLILIGSKNPVKITAVVKVIKKFFPKEGIQILNHEVASNVSNQPIGLENVINGAINRAENILKHFEKEIKKLKSEHLIFGVGIEAGLVEIPHTISGYLDYQFCAIIDQNHNISLGSGSGWEYPNTVVKQVLSDNKIEIGTIMAKISGDPQVKYHNGAIGYYSKNILTRPVITEECIQMALIPHLNKESYFNSK